MILNSKGCLDNYSIDGILTFNFEMKSINILNPCFVTLETANIGQIVAVGICSAVFYNSAAVVFYSVINIGKRFNNLLFKIFFIYETVSSNLF